MELEDRTTGKRVRRRIEGALLPMVLLLAIAAPVFGLGTKRSLAQFGLETWQSDSGLPQNTVHAVLQTRDGFLWIGTDAGLVRFDGVSFRTYDGENTPQFRSDIVSGLEEDRAGSLWISTTAGLVRERDGAFALFTVAQGLPSNAASATHVTAAGHLLAFTAAGVATLRGERFEVVAGTSGMQVVEGGPAIAEDALGHVAIAGSREVVSLAADGLAALRLPVGGGIGELRAVAFLRAGELWVGGRDGIETLESGHAMRLTGSDRLPSSDITALLPDGSGGMWIGTARGLAWWHDGSITRLGAVGEIASASVERLYRDREGTVWAATSQGVARVVDGVVDVIPQRSRLKEVLSILEDREGSMWLGTANGGLTALRERAFSTVSEQDGLAAGAVRAIFQDGDDTIWVGTNGGGLDRIDRGRVSALVSRPALSSDVVLSVAKTGEDLWVGTPNGLDRVRRGSVRVFTTADGLADDFVRSLYADRDGSLWIGTRNGLSHLAGDRFVSYSRMDGLGSDLIGAILRGSRGELWVGTLGGLSRWNGGGFENFSVKDGLATDAVTSMLEDSTGTLWVGTQEGGLNRVREGRITALPVQKSGLPETIFGILEDSMGELWLSSRKGIARVGAGSLSAFADGRAGGPVVRMYGVPDGMRIRECSSGGHPAAWRMHDGSLWFATLDGSAFVSPEGISRNLLAPATVIEQVLLEDRPVEAGLLTGGKALALPPGERRITVQYAGLSFVAPQKVRYRYRLEGFDKDWVDAGDRREAFYTNVPPGRYRFEVLSANNDGVWSTTAGGVFPPSGADAAADALVLWSARAGAGRFGIWSVSMESVIGRGAVQGGAGGAWADRARDPRHAGAGICGDFRAAGADGAADAELEGGGARAA